jgi:hypothetical protein
MVFRFRLLTSLPASPNAFYFITPATTPNPLTGFPPTMSLSNAT